MKLKIFPYDDKEKWVLRKYSGNPLNPSGLCKLHRLMSKPAEGLQLVDHILQCNLDTPSLLLLTWVFTKSGNCSKPVMAFELIIFTLTNEIHCKVVIPKNEKKILP